MSRDAGEFEISVNGTSHRVAPGTTVASLLATLDVAGRVAVERNHEVVPRATHDRVELAPGDELEVVTLVGGG